jgi:hypothetical protein
VLKSEVASIKDEMCELTYNLDSTCFD